MKPYYTSAAVAIYHGEAREVVSGLGGLASHAVLTDPPYGIGYMHGHVKRRFPSRFGGVAVHGDDEPFDPSWLLGFDDLILWGANFYANRLPVESGRWLIWNKREGLARDTHSDAEIAWCRSGLNRSTRMFRHLWREFCERSEGGEKRVHPTQKPVALMEWCIGFLPTQKPVLDCYMGGGSTLLACARAGRDCIGIELEERYCEAAALRLEQQALVDGA